MIFFNSSVCVAIFQFSVRQSSILPIFSLSKCNLLFNPWRDWCQDCRPGYNPWVNYLNPLSFCFFLFKIKAIIVLTLWCCFVLVIVEYIYIYIYIYIYLLFLPTHLLIWAFPVAFPVAFHPPAMWKLQFNSRVGNILWGRDRLILWYSWVFLVTQTVKNLPAMQETWVWFLDWEDPLEEGMKTHPSILVWRIPMDREAWWATVRGVAKSQTGLGN